MFPVGNAACATRAVSSGTGRIGLGCNDTASSPLSEFEPTYPHELLDRKTAERLGPISIRHQCQKGSCHQPQSNRRSLCGCGATTYVAVALCRSACYRSS